MAEPGVVEVKEHVWVKNEHGGKTLAVAAGETISVERARELGLAGGAKARTTVSREQARSTEEAPPAAPATPSRKRKPARRTR